jgi:hypothetical protein
MAPSLTDGVPGLEGQHTLTPPSPFSAITLNANDPMDNGGTFTEAFARLSDISGIHDKPDADDPRVNLVYQSGELPLPRFQRGRSITYSGTIFAPTLSELRAYVAALRALVSNASNDPTAWVIEVAYDPTYDPTDLVFSGYGIPIDFTCDDKQGDPDAIPSGYNRAFTLTFRQSDGRWWVTSDGALCAVGAETPVADGTSGTLTMTGTGPTEPTFTIYGSGTGEATVVITATEVNGKLTIDMPNALNSGDVLSVDFGGRAITYAPTGDGPTVDWTGYIDWSNTNWWNEADVVTTLLVGDNTLTVAGDPWAATGIPAVW